MSETQDTQAAQGPRNRRTKWILAGVAGDLIILVLVHLLAGKPAARGAAAQVVKVAQAVSGDMPET